MADNRRRMKPFGIFMLIYTLLLVLLVAAGLYVFNQFISAYEYSRPVKATDRFFSELTEQYVADHAGEYVASLQNKVQSDEEIYAYLFDCIHGSDCVRAAGESTPTSAVYVLRHNSKNICRLYLTQEADESYGFRAWNVSSIEFNFDPMFVTETVAVPENFSVLYDGTALGSDFISGEKVPYTILEDFYDNPDVKELPCLMQYTVTHTENTAVTVKSSNGSILDPAELSEKLFLNNLSDKELTELTAFTEDYVNRYVTFTSGANLNPSGNYINLVKLVVYGSDLQSRLLQAVGGLGFASSRGDTVMNVTINDTLKISEELYAVDVTYEVETIGSAGPVTTSSNARLLALYPEVDQRFFALAMSRY